MSSLAIRNGRLVLPGGVFRRDLLIENGLISQITPSAQSADRTIDASDLTVLPGFIDIHCHGAAGIDVNTADAEGLHEVSGYLARKGVTSWVPTIVPDTDDGYGGIAQAVGTAALEPRTGARIVGIHYEGVFANKSRCGALRSEHFREFRPGYPIDLPRPDSLSAITTIAPEIPNGIELVGRLVKEGWIVALGHSEVTEETLEQALAKGARHVTHLFNAMSGIHHRGLGLAGWALTRKGVTFDVIADGHHVRPEILEMSLREKGTDDVLLISDSISAAGQGDGDFEIWGKTIKVAGGVATDDQGVISGSVISMSDAVINCARLGFGLREIASMASLNPARLLGIEKETGSIAPGKRADLVLVDRRTNVVETIVAGRSAATAS